jgi:FkbM family methyltransferase
VVAFEADQTNIACFKQTFREEIAQQRVVLVEAALWEAPGILRFAETNSSDSGAVLSVLRPGWDSGPVVVVPATTLDAAVQELNLECVDFIKWNIEGAERHALRGARQTLSRFRPRMVVSINHLYDDPVVIPSWVLEIVPSYRVFSRELQQAYFY